jgi:UDP-N-acetylmuramoyl-L-alanyl-D-glutamate--2,6-diaminopimelate ligase
VTRGARTRTIGRPLLRASSSQQFPVYRCDGTNGKTTTPILLAAFLDAAGRKAGMLGTVAYRVGGEDLEASRTTA